MLDVESLGELLGPEGAGHRLDQLATDQSLNAALTETVDAYMVAMAPTLQALLDASSNAKIRAVASKLPFGLTDCFGFEFPLGRGPSSADFLLAVRRSQAPTLLRAIPCGPIADLVTAWLQPDSTLERKITNLWLEFDLRAAADADHIAGPNAFFGSDAIPGCDGGTAWFTDNALARLRGVPLSSRERRALQMCLERLPPGARVFQTGCMLARDSTATRLCINSINQAQISQYLRAIEWSGDANRLAAVLGELAPLVDAVDLDIDVADSVGPNVGLELYFLPRGDPRHGSRLESLLARLIALGACDDEKRTALLRYPGFDADTEANRQVWPLPLRATAQLTDGRVKSMIGRGVHHIKVSYQPGLPVSAKAYLEAHLSWVVPPTTGRSTSTSLA